MKKHIATIIMTIMLSTNLFSQDATRSVLKDGSIIISPGQELWIKFDKSGEELKNPTVVKGKEKGGYYLHLICAWNFKGEQKKPKVKDSILDFMMKQFPNHTFLVVGKNFDGTLTYNCNVQVKGSKKFTPRNNLPIKGKLPMSEQYPEKITLIRLHSFRVK